KTRPTVRAPGRGSPATRRCVKSEEDSRLGTESALPRPGSHHGRRGHGFPLAQPSQKTSRQTAVSDDVRLTPWLQPGGGPRQLRNETVLTVYSMRQALAYRI